MKKITLSLIYVLLLTGCDQVVDDWFKDPRTERPKIPPVIEAELDCKVECKVGEESHKCIFINATVSRPEYRNRVFDFSLLFDEYSSTETIPHPVIMNLFDNQEDKCNRGGIAFSADGFFSNVSTKNQACYLNYSNTTFGEISLGVPARLSGRLIKDPTNNNYDISFPNNKNSLELLFSDTDLHNILGGHILEINVSNNRIFYRTQTACLASAI